LNKIIRTLLIVLSISVGFSQFNDKGTKAITFTVKIEPYTPPDEIITLHLKKSGVESHDTEGSDYIGKYWSYREGSYYTPMEKISDDEWQVTVELDTSLVTSGGTGGSKWAYHYARNFSFPAMEDREPLKSEGQPDGQYRTLFGGWHKKVPLVQIDTVKKWWWPLPKPEDLPTLNTTGHLSSAPENIKTSSFQAGVNMLDWHRDYWTPIIENQLDNIVKTNASWLQIIPIIPMSQAHPTPVLDSLHANGMPEADMVKAVTEAKRRGLKVFLYTLSPGTSSDYNSDNIDTDWYINYYKEWRIHMLKQANLAEKYGVEMLGFHCWSNGDIDSEHESTVDSLSKILLDEVRSVYSGKIAMDYRERNPNLTIYQYSDYLRVALHTHGLTSSGLSNEVDPTVEEILDAVRNRTKTYESIYLKWGKPIVVAGLTAASFSKAFGGLGNNYDNVPGIANFYESDPSIPIDLQAQADSYEAMLLAVHDYDWIIGAFSFNYWIADMYDKNISIRSKTAEKVLAKWYRWINSNNVHLTTSINNQWTTSPYQKGGTTSLSPGSYIYTNGTTVNVSAIPDSGYRFVKWAGDASGSSKSISIMMNTDKSISALFEANPGPDPSDLVPPGPFDLVYPFDDTTIVLTTDNFLDTLYFAWNQSIDPGGDDVNYSRELTGDLPKYIKFVVPADEKISTNMYKVPYHAIERYMHRASVELISGTWTIMATDGTHDVYAENGPFTLTIDGSKLEIADNDLIPETFALHANYPNPFNPTTTISYDLPEQSQITLGIYDILGKQIKTLINQSQDAGSKIAIWDGTDNLGRQVSAGVYLYQIQAGAFTQTRKMLLLK
jgi:hypothetical protein